MHGFGSITVHIDKVGSGKQRSDLDGKGEGTVAGILFPPVLTGRRAVCQNIGRGAVDHRHKIRPRGMIQVTMSMQHIRQQDRKGAFIHLDAWPIGFAIQPEILRPAARWLLYLTKIIEDRQRLVVIAGRQKSAGRFHQIARPDQVITTEIVIALRCSPRDRQACNNSARSVGGTMCGEHCCRHPIGIDAVMRIAVERFQPVLPVAPVGNVGLVRPFKAMLQTINGRRSRFIFRLAKAERQCCRAIDITEVDLTCQRDISVIGSLVLFNDASVPMQLLPTIGNTHETGADCPPGQIADKRKIS
ncbi:hypothetical protein D3C87_1109390 [compost metagenome]